MKKFIIWGALIGFLVILYDYDFLLNVGGPNTPITRSIIKLLYPDKFICCWEAFRIASLITTGIGLLAGLISGSIWWLFRKMRQN